MGFLIAFFKVSQCLQESGIPYSISIFQKTEKFAKIQQMPEIERTAGNLYEGRVSMPEEEMTGILRAQALRYPKMEPQDAVKLLYQAAFGCGHAVNNRSDALRAVSKEYEILRGRSHTAEKRADPIEPIGGGYARLWLGSIDTEQLTLRNLCDMFTVTEGVLCALDQIIAYFDFRGCISFFQGGAGLVFDSLPGSGVSGSQP